MNKTFLTHGHDNYKNKTNDFITFYVIVFFLMDSLKRMYLDLYLSELHLIIGLISFPIVIFKIWEVPAGYKSLLWFGLLMFFLYISGLYTQNIRLGFGHLAYFSVAMLMLKSILNYRLIFIAFISVSLYFIVLIFSGADPNDIFLTSSRNYISNTMFIWVALVYISNYMNGFKGRLYPALIGFFIAIISLGRAGIIASSFLLFTLIIFFLIQNNTRRKTFSLLIASILIILYVIQIDTTQFISSSIVNESVTFVVDRFTTQGLESSGRRVLINEYFGIINNDTLSLVFGVDIDYMTANLFTSNLHNSFLTLHANYGLFGFILVFMTFFLAISIYTFQKNFIFIVLLLSIMMRAFSDTVAFSGMLDPIIYFLLLYPIFEAPNKYDTTA